jgi:hypothetical protein
MPAEKGAQELPPCCLRGIRKRGWLYEAPSGSFVHQEAFMPGETCSVEGNGTGWLETSINWEDDDRAVEFTRAQKSEKGQLLNPHGVVRLPVTAIDHCMANTPIAKTFARERRVLTGNRYHGNLLFEPSLPKQMIRMLAGMLALASKLVPESGGESDLSTG